MTTWPKSPFCCCCCCSRPMYSCGPEGQPLRHVHGAGLHSADRHSCFYDTRTALFTHIVSLLIIGFEAPSGFEFMFIQTIAGMVAIFTIVSMSRRVQFFISVLMIFAAYSIAFVGVTILHEANFRSIDWMNLKWFAANSVLTLFAFPLIFIFEKTFGFLSDVSLMELADSNSPLAAGIGL